MSKQNGNANGATGPTRRRSILGLPRSHRGDPDANPYGSHNSLHRYHYGFFHPALAPLRKGYLKLVIGGTVMIIILLWSCLPLYWGSFWLALSHAPSLEGWIIDRDGGLIGQQISQALVNASLGIGDPEGPGGKGHLGWRVVSPADVGDDAALENELVNDAAWVAVVISEGATQRLITARENGDPTYDASQVITWYFVEARNEDATDFIVLPLTLYILAKSTAQLNAQLAAEYLPQIAGNSTAVMAIARAPQTISGPVGYTEVNLRPFTALTAIAVELVGSIYLIIISFIWSNVHAQARMIISPHLTTRSYVLMRVIFPLIVYLPLSLAYAMISLPFKLPFDGRYTYAGGFFLFWCFCYLSICALGLAIEAMITILTPRFAALFLVPWIISNVSVASLPFELQPWFYRYGNGFPVYNLSQAVRVILFNTRNNLGLNAGILLAWAALSLITMPLFTLIMRAMEMKKARREQAQGKEIEAGYEGGGTQVEDS